MIIVLMNKRAVIAPVTVFREKRTGNFSVIVNINGKDVGMMYDTGTSTSIITEEVTSRLGLTAGVTPRFVNVNMRIGTTGRAFTTRIVVGRKVESKISLLSANDVTKAGLTAILTPTGARLVSKEQTPGSGISLEYLSGDTGLEHVPYVTAKINGRNIRARIDTGTLLSMMNKQTATSVGISENQFKRRAGFASPEVTTSIQIGSRPAITTTIGISETRLGMIIGLRDIEKMGYTQVYGGNRQSRLI